MILPKSNNNNGSSDLTLKSSIKQSKPPQTPKPHTNNSRAEPLISNRFSCQQPQVLECLQERLEENSDFSGHRNSSMEGTANTVSDKSLAEVELDHSDPELDQDDEPLEFEPAMSTINEVSTVE